MEYKGQIKNDQRMKNVKTAATAPLRSTPLQFRYSTTRFNPVLDQSDILLTKESFC